ncbi:exonuclease domain-containing protein [Arcicella lustrica]|uniref:Exonuclease domain-containing protein n=1 Tax=Arcicella lustrica TaxID=2984196 RepID=A0ABU5SMB5_9BACT|nr:exonuclease domain-containing protein [Arcicella sp. DC25W]MEA5428441.1 exonuclease domain-containing protein [Arcicella sp. DC25W]
MKILDKVFSVLKKVDNKTPLAQQVSATKVPKVKAISAPHNFDFDYVVLDIKTANLQPKSIFSVAIVALKNDKVVDKRHWFVRPNPFNINPIYFQNSNFSRQDLEVANSFSEVWQELNPYIINQKIVAHFADFNIGALKSALCSAQLLVPKFTTFCTYLNAKKTWGFPDFQLHSLADYLHLKVRGGEMLKDVDLCTRIFLKLKKENGELIFNNKSETPKSTVVTLNSNSFLGRNIAVAGAFQHFKHYEIKEKIRALGGIHVKNVTHKTNFLIIGSIQANEICPKRIDAQTFKVKIINEEQFLALLASQHDFQEV